MKKLDKLKKKSGGLIDEFKSFALKGNALDLAVGVIIGGAFGKITSSLVGDVIMPAIGLLLGGVDFTDLTVVLPSIWDGVEPAEIRYGAFLNNIVDFLIISLTVFFMIKAISLLRKKDTPPPPEPEPEPEPSAEVKLLAEIRDLLASNKTEQEDR